MMRPAVPSRRSDSALRMNLRRALRRFLAVLSALTAADGYAPWL
jgi:hypothetical protein